MSFPSPVKKRVVDSNARKFSVTRRNINVGSMWWRMREKKELAFKSPLGGCEMDEMERDLYPTTSQNSKIKTATNKKELIRTFRIEPFLGSSESCEKSVLQPGIS